MKIFEVLALHRAIAEFAGIQHFPCRHMTSLCPGKCNHAHDSAVFRIVEYELHEKPGRHGNEKQSVYHVRLDQKVEAEQQDPAVLAIIQGLTPGQKVRIHWEHIYVTKDGSKWPERPLRTIEKV
jgi:hypothetical protein